MQLVRALSTAAAILLLAGLLPRSSTAQGIIVNVYPREAATDTALVAELARREAERKGVPMLADTALARVSRQAQARIGRWSRVTDTTAAQLWGRGRQSLLPGASFSPGTERTEVYTELAQEVSGGWRFVLGTALAIQTAERDEDEPGAQQEDGETDPATGFRRFLAGGGNVSLAAMRPLGMQVGTYHSQLIVLTPRGWANVPTLGATDDVSDFGGEISAEYLYLRYARTFDQNGALTARPDLPFLTASLRGGVVMGTHPFYRSIGHSDERLFPYVVPRVSLQFANGVRLGAAYFYGFGTFRQHERIRLQINVDPGVERQRR
jgi:hypothetical protein